MAKVVLTYIFLLVILGATDSRARFACQCLGATKPQAASLNQATDGGVGVASRMLSEESRQLA